MCTFSFVWVRVVESGSLLSFQPQMRITVAIHDPFEMFGLLRIF